jgi:hypothetical protein
MNDFKIPRSINLCYKHKNIPSVVTQNIRSLNPNYEVKVFGDEECCEFLGDEFGGDHAECFSFIPDGAIKADFWRAAVIYKNGGVYFDADVEHVAGIDEYLDPKATFLTSTSWNGTNMNPIVLMSRPRNEALGLCVDWYVEAFRRKAPYSYWGWSICERLADALRKTLGRSVGNDRAELISHGDDLYQFVNEDKRSGSRQGYHTHWKGMKIIKNHRDEYVETPGFKGFRGVQKTYEDENLTIDVASHPYKDTFDISVKGSVVSVRRTDENLGWGQDLRLSVLERSSGKKKTVQVGSSHSNTKKVEMAEWTDRETTAVGPKMLIVLAGEAFRHGHQGSRTRDVPDSFEPQRRASLSHMELARALKERWGMGCDIILSTYKTNHEADIVGWYGANLVASSFRSGSHWLGGLVQDALGGADLESYESVFVCRVDLELKKHFMEVFNPKWDRIMFPSMCWVSGAYLTAGPDVWVPRISDTMVFAPKRLANQMAKSFHLCHEAWLHYKNDGVPEDGMGLMIDTFHDSDSAKDYNPLYRMVGRPESRRWHSPNLVAGPNHAPVRTHKHMGFPDWGQAATEPYEDEDMVIGLKYDQVARKDQFSICVDRAAGTVELRRLDEDGGWDADVFIHKLDKRTGSWGGVHVGRSDTNSKTVRLDSVTDSYEDEEIRVGVRSTHHPDAFRLAMSSPGELSIARLDHSSGWGQDLHLEVLDKTTLKKATLRVGPSDSQTKTVRIGGLVFGD